MADLPDDTSLKVDPDPTTSTPRWVKVFGIIALGLVFLLGVIIILDLGGHGPGSHMPSGDPGGHTPPIEHGS